MARLIDADELKEKLKDMDIVLVKHDVEDWIDEQPTVDAEPVRHGKWIQPHWKNSNYCCNCSECGGEAMHREYHWDKNGIYPICPNCGAKIDKE